jgi:hypothetical protein
MLTREVFIGMTPETEMYLVGAVGALTFGSWDSTRSERQILFLQGAANGDETNK